MGEFSLDILNNIEIFQVNRLPAHSDHDYWKDEFKAESEETDQRFLLNGVWSFNYSTTATGAPEGFEKNDYDVTSWDNIKVPAHIQMEGYGAPAYVNTQYPWDGHEELMPGQTPQLFNPTGSYVRFFDLPDFMKEGPVYISFQGAESAIAVWLNGSFVGYSEDSFTPSEFDLTPYVNRDGSNKLAVRCFRFSSSSWCDDQDFFRFSGIFRDVYLYTTPKIHARDIKINTDLDDSYKDAVLRVEMDVVSRDDVTPGKAQYVLTDADGNEVAKADIDISTDTKAEIKVENPNKWSAEDPYLYDLEIRLFDKSGEQYEYITEKVGFRRFEMINNIMCLNGKRIVFFGADRHEFSCETGRVLPDEDILKDIITMKRNNINAIRTSHYPNKTKLYRLCDLYGLYLIDETNLETHGTWDAISRGIFQLDFAVPGDRPEFMELILDRARSMYERDKNHPSILIWSCGNESYGGTDMLKMSNEMRKWDPSRLIHYEGVWWDTRYPETTDMVSVMYIPVDEVKEFLSEHRDKPFIACEYAHAMGNSCGAIDKYVKLSEEEELYQGGFIWDYIDQSLTMTDRYGVEFQAYGGDFGERPNDGAFSGNGIVYGKDREPSPKMQEVKFVYQPIKVEFDDADNMIITNKSLFTSTDVYDCLITLEKEGKIISKEHGMIAVNPLSEKQIKIPAELPDAPGEYVLTVSFCLKEDTIWASKGHEIAYGQKVIGKREAVSHVKKPYTVTHGWINTGIRGENFEVLFSNLVGGMISYKYAGRELIKQMPKPNFWRSMTENDIANLLPFRAGQWKLASMYANYRYEHGRKGTDYVITEKDDSVDICFTYHLPTKPERDALLTYTVYGDGVIDVHLELEGAAEVGELPEFGVLFTMDADYDRLKWYGLGPDETYMDRAHAKLGIYENKVADNMASYLRPQECGNKVGTRWACVTDRSGVGLYFEGDDLSFSALPYTPHELDNAQHTNELPPILSTYVRVSAAQMGVGGDDTWGALVHPEYLLDTSDKLTLDFSFRGVTL